MDSESESDNSPFTERTLRKYLSSIYVAMIGSNRNVDLMLKAHPADVRSEQIGGYDEARAGMEDACAWMRDVEIACEDKRTFDDVILGTARLVARYVASVRNLDEHTVPLDCWVFQKSDPYGAAYGEQTTVSMIVPEIESCMSIRLDAELAKMISPGFWRFESVLPMPLINRLHHTTRKISSIDGIPSLGSWNFLKVSFEDRVLRFAGNGQLLRNRIGPVQGAPPSWSAAHIVRTYSIDRRLRDHDQGSHNGHKRHGDACGMLHICAQRTGTLEKRSC